VLKKARSAAAQAADTNVLPVWMQSLVAAPTRPLDTAIREYLRLSDHTIITWLSPLADDDYAEYRDTAWLDRMDLLHLASDLRNFWPDNGPQWDGLAKTSDGKLLLFEAKAHAREMLSHCAASTASREKIIASLECAKTFYGARPEGDWLTSFYRYANRLAHLQFLRERQVDAHLLFVYFLNDMDMRGPSSLAEWVRAIDDCNDWLGLERKRTHLGVHEIFIDVSRPAG
jgi:hypothetical protein